MQYLFSLWQKLLKSTLLAGKSSSREASCFSS
jgi:hypothetical protein